MKSTGISLLGAMFLIFLTLKLCGVINWSWWWVTAPLWAPIGIYVAVILGLALFSGLCLILVKLLEKV